MRKCVFASLGIAVLAVGCSRTVNLSDDWETVKKDARSAGVPLTISESLKDFPKVTQKDNAAVAFKKAMTPTLEPLAPGKLLFQQGYTPAVERAHQNISSSQSKWFIAGTRPNWTALREDLKTLRPILKAVARALETPKWDFHRDWAQGLALLYPDLAMSKNLAKWYRAEALLAAYEHRDQDALQAVQTPYRLAAHLRTEPSLICRLVAIAIDVINDRTAQDVARLRPGKSALLSRLEKLVSASSRSGEWQSIWDFEYACIIEALNPASPANLTEFAGDAQKVTPPTPEQISKGRTETVKLLIEAKRAMKAKPTDVKAMLAVVPFDSKIQQMLGRTIPILKEPMGDTGLESIYAQAANAELSSIARQRLTRLFLRMVGSGGKGGWHLPAEASRPEFADPFTGKPMKLKSEGSGFRLYSIGPNGMDDHGSQARRGGGPFADIVVTYPFFESSVGKTE